MKRPRCWVIATAMGYGHQRAAFSLRKLALRSRVLSADAYPGIPAADALIWNELKLVYETVSRMQQLPVFGSALFHLFDRLQNIREFYPVGRPIKEPTLQLKQTYALMERFGWGRHLIEKLNKNPLPIVTTFPIIALMAERWEYKGNIHLVVTDADIARSWASRHPAKSRIRYFVPSKLAKSRLQRYGVRDSSIKTTGFPLPQELIGKNQAVARKDAARRLLRLDPAGRTLARYHLLLEPLLGPLPRLKSKKPVVITFAVGGAGAQLDIARAAAKSLGPTMKKGDVHMNVTLETRTSLVSKLKSDMTRQVSLFAFPTKEKYFSHFNSLMRSTDILWTKPSELVFYGALGIPLVLTPPLGSQEAQNKKWILTIGAAVNQLEPSLAREWIHDLLEEGTLAEAAMEGFVEMEKEGVSNIMRALKHP